MGKILKNNHKDNGKYKNIKESSKAFANWKEGRIKSDKKEDTYRFVFRGFSKVIREKKLNSSEMSLYFAIFEESDRNTGICKKPNSYFIDTLGMAKNTLDKALNGLEEKEMIYRSVSYDENNRLTRAISILPY